MDLALWTNTMFVMLPTQQTWTQKKKVTCDSIKFKTKTVKIRQSYVDGAWAENQQSKSHTMVGKLVKNKQWLSVLNWFDHFLVTRILRSCCTAVHCNFRFSQCMVWHLGISLPRILHTVQSVNMSRWECFIISNPVIGASLSGQWIFELLIAAYWFHGLALNRS